MWLGVFFACQFFPSLFFFLSTNLASAERRAGVHGSAWVSGARAIGCPGAFSFFFCVESRTRTTSRVSFFFSVGGMVTRGPRRARWRQRRRRAKGKKKPSSAQTQPTKKNSPFFDLEKEEKGQNNGQKKA
ncbi:hypothetical protein [Pandoravirus japonicus]|uniref:Uncharacterized protein n=1 Tax=Pandoravirus japonicus TaxID=2823154 RepID=A0A811BPV3_9VIRU|nr:hypothetical protein [Pandoravirus japonicus]